MRYTDPNYFWAVRGGSGIAWGVVTSVTYMTHLWMQRNLTSSTLVTVREQDHRAYGSSTCNGWHENI